MKKAKRVIVAATVMASLVTATPVMAFKWEIGQKKKQKRFFLYARIYGKICS
mgnify:CR=1 FL=1